MKKILLSVTIVLTFYTIGFTQTLNPKDTVQNITFLVTTSSDFRSGTKDDVWFDLGPKAWRYRGGFTEGQTKTIYIDPSDIQSGVSLNTGLEPLLVEDITELRLEKKGIEIPGFHDIGGITNAPDDVSLISDIENLIKPASPKETLQSLQDKVDQAQTFYNEKEADLNKAQKYLDALNKDIATSVTIINGISDVAGTATRKVSDLRSQMNDLNGKISNAGKSVSKEICKDKWSLLRWALGGPILGWKKSCETSLVPPNPNIVRGLQNQFNEANAKLQIAENEVVSAPTKKANELAHLSLLQTNQATWFATTQTCNAEYRIAEDVLAQAKGELAKCKELLAKMPSIIADGIQFPQEGQWLPLKVTLYLNNIEYCSFSINERLKMGHPSWTSNLGNLTDGQRFAEGLRVNQNGASKVFDEQIARFTTIFGKDNHISGWEPGPVKTAEAVGKLVNPPSAGADGYVSFDIEVEQIVTNGDTFILDGQHGINHTRYIRIEHIIAQRNNGLSDDRYTKWGIGKRIKVFGDVRRDTDRITFFEIHPRSANDITELN